MGIERDSGWREKAVKNDGERMARMEEDKNISYGDGAIQTQTESTHLVVRIL